MSHQSHDLETLRWSRMTVHGDLITIKSCMGLSCLKYQLSAVEATSMISENVSIQYEVPFRSFHKRIWTRVLSHQSRYITEYTGDNCERLLSYAWLKLADMTIQRLIRDSSASGHRLAESNIGHACCWQPEGTCFARVLFHSPILCDSVYKPIHRLNHSFISILLLNWLTWNCKPVSDIISEHANSPNCRAELTNVR